VKFSVVCLLFPCACVVCDVIYLVNKTSITTGDV
jgi:hypothetical protein